MASGLGQYVPYVQSLHKQHLPKDPNSNDVYYSNYHEKYMDRLENVLYVGLMYTIFRPLSLAVTNMMQIITK